MAEVTNLRSYHTPEGDTFTPVVPVRQPYLRAVWMSESDTEVLENVGVCLCKLGAADSGQVLLEIAKAWRQSDGTR